MRSRSRAGQLSERFALSMVDRTTTAAANLLVRWLLMLTPTAFEGEAGSLLVAELSAALRDGIAPIMLFVPQKCTFDDVLQVTPQALIDAGLYSGRPALEWHSGALRPVSERQVARELGEGLLAQGLLLRRRPVRVGISTRAAFSSFKSLKGGFIRYGCVL